MNNNFIDNQSLEFDIDLNTAMRNSLCAGCCGSENITASSP